MNSCPAPWWRTTLVVLGVTLAIPGAALAAIIHVPTQLPTVRAAVDSAASGDTVLVAPGVHPGGVYVNGKAVTIASWFIVTGDTSFVSQTVLDSVAGDPCGGSLGCAGNAVIEFASDAGGSAVVGLTIQHGVDGVRSRAIADITHCRLLANADGMDYQSDSGGLIRASLFAYNSDDGIDINGRTSVQIIGNVVRDNHQDGIEFRLYPHLGPTLTPAFIGNTIADNGGDGIQLIDYPDTSNRVIRIERNLFMRNQDAAVGCMPDGLTDEDFSGAPIAERVYLVNNTFADQHYGLSGGANVIALNNVFAGTRQTALWRMGGNSIASHCLFWNNQQDHAQSNLGVGIVYADPRLDPQGSPESGSPAIDTGIDHYAWLGETVLDLPVGAYAGAMPDLGAFERGGSRPDGNLPPRVEAGPDQTVLLPAPAWLAGAVWDDWLPISPLRAVRWSLGGGPGPVTFENANASGTYATFPVAGEYVLRFAASDGSLGVADSLVVRVLPIGSHLVERRIGAASDDQEETATGTISPNTSDIELVLGPTVQKIGLRFTGIALPPGAVVTRAHVQFESDEIQGEPTSLLVQGQAGDDPGTFTLDNFNVSARPRTTASVVWTPPPWNVVGEQGADQRTPDLSTIVQEILDRPGWASGNAMAFIITGSGHRTARSYEGLPSGAAKFHVETISAVTGVGSARTDGLALRGVHPNPSRGALRVELTLADGDPATLELVDVAGRRVLTRELRSFTPGSHSLELRESLPAGVYLVRLVQLGRVRTVKAVVLR